MNTIVVLGGSRAVLLDQAASAPWLIPDGSTQPGQWAGDAPWMRDEPQLARLAGAGFGLAEQDSPVLWVVGRGVNRSADRYLSQDQAVTVGGEVFVDEVPDADLASVVLLPCAASAVQKHGAGERRRVAQDRRAGAAVAAVRRQEMVARKEHRGHCACCPVGTRGPVDDSMAVDLAGVLPAALSETAGVSETAGLKETAVDDSSADAVGDGAGEGGAGEGRAGDGGTVGDAIAPGPVATPDPVAGPAGRLDRVAVAAWRARLAGLPVGPAVAAHLVRRPGPPSVVDLSQRPGGSDQWVWANTLLDSITARRQLINHLQALQARDEYDLERNYPGLVENLPFEMGSELHLTDGQAERELSVASSSHSRLPAAVAAWRTGRICGDKVRTLTEQTQKLELSQARAVAEKVLPAAAEQTVPAFRAAVRRAVLDIDPDGAEQRHREAKDQRRVRKYVLEDGMAELRYTDVAQHVQLLWELVNELSSAAKTPGDKRSTDQRRADALADMADAIARHGVLMSSNDSSPTGDDSTPHDAESPDPESPETAESETAESATDKSRGGDPADASVEGTVETATETTPEKTNGTTGESGAGAASDSGPESADDSCTEASENRPRVTRRRRRPRRPKRIRPRVRINVTMPITVLAGGVGTCELAGYGPITAGQAWTLAGDAELRRMLCDPIDGTLINAGVERYRPPEWLREQIIAREVTCVAPGCRQPAELCDIDHRKPWPHGRTCMGNLQPLCRHHHRCKDGGGFTVTKEPDGSYRWRTPLGRTVVRPPTRWLHPRTTEDDGTPGMDDGARSAAPRGASARANPDVDPPPF